MSLVFTSSSLVAFPVFTGTTETSRLSGQVDFSFSQVCVLSAQIDSGDVGSAPLNQPLETCFAHCTEECV